MKASSKHSFGADTGLSRLSIYLERDRRHEVEYKARLRYASLLNSFSAAILPTKSVILLVQASFLPSTNV